MSQQLGQGIQVDSLSNLSGCKRVPEGIDFQLDPFGIFEV
jgi:hypothetical protein